MTVDGVSYPLGRPFMVLATQNPIEYEGTYPLPEAQLDRFTMRLSIGYPPLADEARMLNEQTSEPPLDSLEPVSSTAEIVALIEDAKRVFVEESVNRYVVALLRHTRGDERLYLGASPRAGIALLRVAKARAISEGREYVLPDDVKAVAEPVLGHRLILGPEARAAGLGRPSSSRTRSSGSDARSRAPRQSFTARGRFTLALGAGTYLGAWAFGAHVLYAPAIGLLLAVGAALIWTNAVARPLSLHRQLDRDRPSRATTSSSGSSSSRTAASCRRRCCCTSRWGGWETRRSWSPGTDGSSAPCTASPVSPRPIPIHRARAVVEDPFGLAQRVQPFGDASPLIVYPRLARLNVLFGERGLRAHGAGRILLRRPPASSCTACASTRAASRSAACTGPRPRADTS